METFNRVEWEKIIVSDTYKQTRKDKMGDADLWPVSVVYLLFSKQRLPSGLGATVSMDMSFKFECNMRTVKYYDKKEHL